MSSGTVCCCCAACDSLWVPGMPGWMLAHEAWASTCGKAMPLAASAQLASDVRKACKPLKLLCASTAEMRQAWPRLCKPALKLCTHEERCLYRPPLLKRTRSHVTRLSVGCTRKACTARKLRSLNKRWAVSARRMSGQSGRATDFEAPGSRSGASCTKVVRNRR